MPSTFFAPAAWVAGNEKSKSQVVRIATAPWEMSSEALVAAVGLSDFVSIHLTFICLPRTPPALLSWSMRSWKS